MRKQIRQSELELVRGDITDQEVDAIVNAANARLAGGGGVDGAIHRRGGPSIMQETNRRYPDGCPTGSAVITSGGDLPAKFVIHAVGPIWNGGGHGEEQLLAAAYRKSLELAVENNCDSIAFPSLSTGAYRFPIDQASTIALATVADQLRRVGKPAKVRFVLWDDAAFDAFRQALEQIEV